jgi:hypothetical protein
MSAVIVGPYRYRLDRVVHGVWGTDPVALVLGVNPSTADAELNDPTVVRVLGFGAVNRWSRIIMGNKFALRSTDVTNLRYATDPVGPLNDTFLAAMMTEADKIICAWGPLAKLPPGYVAGGVRSLRSRPASRYGALARRPMVNRATHSCCATRRHLWNGNRRFGIDRAVNVASIHLASNWIHEGEPICQHHDAAKSGASPYTVTIARFRWSLAA